MQYTKVSIQKKGSFYKVTGGHLPSMFVASKKNAQDIAAARLKLLEQRTALLQQEHY